MQQDGRVDEMVNGGMRTRQLAEHTSYATVSTPHYDSRALRYTTVCITLQSRMDTGMRVSATRSHARVQRSTFNGKSLISPLPLTLHRPAPSRLRRLEPPHPPPQGPAISSPRRLEPRPSRTRARRLEPLPASRLKDPRPPSRAPAPAGLAPPSQAPAVSSPYHFKPPPSLPALPRAASRVHGANKYI